MASLALPTVGAKNLTAIWDKHIRSIIEKGDGSQDAPTGRTLEDHNESLRMAENASQHGLGITTLQVLDDETKRPVSVHIVVNTARNKALVVGQKVPSKLQAAFNEAGITHVDRSEANARLRIEGALNELTRNMNQKTRLELSAAFLYRNVIDNDKEGVSEADRARETPKKLADIMLDARLDSSYDKYLVWNKPKAA